MLGHGWLGPFRIEALLESATVAGANAQALFTKDRKQAYFLVGIEPEMDCAYPLPL